MLAPTVAALPSRGTKPSPSSPACALAVGPLSSAQACFVLGVLGVPAREFPHLPPPTRLDSALAANSALVVPRPLFEGPDG
jgi:hypothetical protein